MADFFRDAALVVIGPLVERLGYALKSREEYQAELGELVNCAQDIVDALAERDAETRRADAAEEELREVERLLRAFAKAAPGSDAETDAKYGLAVWVTSRVLEVKKAPAGGGVAA